MLLFHSSLSDVYCYDAPELQEGPSKKSEAVQGLRLALFLPLLAWS